MVVLTFVHLLGFVAIVGIHKGCIRISNSGRHAASIRACAHRGFCGSLWLTAVLCPLVAAGSWYVTAGRDWDESDYLMAGLTWLQAVLCVAGNTACFGCGAFLCGRRLAVAGHRSAGRCAFCQYPKPTSSKLCTECGAGQSSRHSAQRSNGWRAAFILLAAISAASTVWFAFPAGTRAGNWLRLIPVDSYVDTIVCKAAFGEPIQVRTYDVDWRFDLSGCAPLSLQELCSVPDGSVYTTRVPMSLAGKLTGYPSAQSSQLTAWVTDTNRVRLQLRILSGVVECDVDTSAANDVRESGMFWTSRDATCIWRAP
jgi:hypothetical protein